MIYESTPSLSSYKKAVAALKQKMALLKEVAEAADCACGLEHDGSPEGIRLSDAIRAAREGGALESEGT